jgi:hypothetical protein
MRINFCIPELSLFVLLLSSSTYADWIIRYFSTPFFGSTFCDNLPSESFLCSSCPDPSFVEGSL